MRKEGKCDFLIVYVETIKIYSDKHLSSNNGRVDISGNLFCDFFVLLLLFNQ